MIIRSKNLFRAPQYIDFVVEVLINLEKRNNGCVASSKIISTWFGVIFRSLSLSLSFLSLFLSLSPSLSKKWEMQ